MTVGRRTFLRGCGTALALPFLEAFAPVEALAGGGGGPVRLAFVFAPNGIHMPAWTPGAEGAAFALPPLLEPLAPVRREVLVVSGLAHRNGAALGDGPGDHARSSAVFLTGVHPLKTAGQDVRLGISADQLAARRLAPFTRFPSLELGCEPARLSGQCDSGYSCAYSSYVSWRGPGTPNAKEIDPRIVFERLFGGGRAEDARARVAGRRSVLDFVREDAARLWAEVGAADRGRLDEYLEGVREVERRLEMGERAARGDLVGGMAAPAGIPAAYAEHVRLLYDLIVLAFRADLTRVATFMVANEGSNRSYPAVGVRAGHHELSHHGGDPDKIAQIVKINRFHMEEFGRFLGRLAAVREGAGTLLDSCAVVFGSGISDGNRHSHDDLPVLVAGRAGGALAPGRHLRVAPGTPMCNLYLSLLDTVDAAPASFGDSTGRLPGLS